MKPMLSLVRCEAAKVWSGVTCLQQLLVDHYGEHPSNDGGYSLCAEHEQHFMKQIKDGLQKG